MHSVTSRRSYSGPLFKHRAPWLHVAAFAIACLVALTAEAALAGELAPLKGLPAVRVAVVFGGSGLTEEFFTQPIELQLRLRGIPVTRDNEEHVPVLMFRLLTYELPEPERAKGIFYVGEIRLIETAALRRGGLELDASVWQSDVLLGTRPALDSSILKVATDLADQFATDYLVANSPSK